MFSFNCGNQVGKKDPEAKRKTLALPKGLLIIVSPSLPSLTSTINSPCSSPPIGRCFGRICPKYVYTYFPSRKYEYTYCLYLPGVELLHLLRFIYSRYEKVVPFRWFWSVSSVILTIAGFSCCELQSSNMEGHWFFYPISTFSKIFLQNCHSSFIKDRCIFFLHLVQFPPAFHYELGFLLLQGRRYTIPLSIWFHCLPLITVRMLFLMHNHIFAVP